MSRVRVPTASPSASLWLAVAVFLLAPPPPAAASQDRCLPDGGGALKMTLSGAHDMELDWPDDGTTCHGAGTRFGVGVNFGRTVAAGTTLTVGLTIKELGEGETGDDLPVDVSIGGNAVGDDMFRSAAGSCTVAVTEQELVREDAAGRLYRITGTGECSGPITGMVGGGEITVGTFEFTGATQWTQ